MATTCESCGKIFGSGEKRYSLSGKTLCSDCLEKESQRGNTCPCCGTNIPSDAYEVGLVLTPPGSSIIKKARSVEVLAIVCPKCKVLFFDDFTYETIQSLKK